MSEKPPRVRQIALDFVAGTDISSAVGYMYELHCQTGADVETVFNSSLIVVADNKMFDRFGFKKFREARNS